MEARYNIYFAGQLLAGQDLATVRSKLAKIFNADEPTLDKLFSGKTQLLKRDCDKATALKYKQAIERAGAQAVIKAVADAPVQSASVAPAMSAAERIAALAAAPDEIRYGSSDKPAAAAAAPSQEDSTDEGVGLAPAGSDVLREDERSTPVTREIDTSGLAVDASAQRLSEESAAPPAAPDTSHLDMGAVGEMIPNLPSHEEPLSPNIDSIDLAPDGTDFSDCAAPEAAEPALDLSQLNLAPEGAELLDEEYRNKQQATAPATDHIALED